MACISVLGGLAMEWRSVKKEEGGLVRSAEDGQITEGGETGRVEPTDNQANVTENATIGEGRCCGPVLRADAEPITRAHIF